MHSGPTVIVRNTIMHTTFAQTLCERGGGCWPKEPGYTPVNIEEPQLQETEPLKREFLKWPCESLNSRIVDYIDLFWLAKPAPTLVAKSYVISVTFVCHVCVCVCHFELGFL